MQERGRQTRAGLIEAMRQAIQARGVSRASIGDVLKATGAKKGSLYFHFRDKDELALAALDEAGEEFHDFVAEALRGGDTPEERLEAFFRRVLALHRGKGFVGGCIFGNTSLEMADADRRYAQLMRQVFTGWADQLSAVIAQAQEAGQVRGDLAPESLARQALAAIEGGVMFARLSKSEQPLEEALETLWALMREDRDPARARLTEASV